MIIINLPLKINTIVIGPNEDEIYENIEMKIERPYKPGSVSISIASDQGGIAARDASSQL